MLKPMGKFIEKSGCETQKDFAFSSGTETLQLTPQIQYARVSGAAIAGTVYLPPVTEMSGRIVCVVASSVATGNVTVKPYNNVGGTLADAVIYGTSGAVASFTLAAAEAHALLYSTGDRWIILSFDLSL